MNLLNTKEFARIDGYKVIHVNEKNFTSFVSSEAQTRISSVM